MRGGSTANPRRSRDTANRALSYQRNVLAGADKSRTSTNPESGLISSIGASFFRQYEVSTGGQHVDR